MKEYRSLASTIRQIILEDYAQNWFKEQGITNFKAVGEYGYVYKRGKVWRYRKPESKSPSRDSWDNEKEAEEALLLQYPKKPEPPEPKVPETKNQDGNPPETEASGENITGPNNVKLAQSLQKDKQSQDKTQQGETQDGETPETQDGETPETQDGETPETAFGGKNKTLGEINKEHIETHFHTNELEDTDEDFYAAHREGGRLVQTKDIELTEDGEFVTERTEDGEEVVKDGGLFKFSEEIKNAAKGKVASIHLTELERLINVRVVKNINEKWEEWSTSPAGEGGISSRAGELLSLVAIALPKKESSRMLNDMKKHTEAQMDYWLKKKLQEYESGKIKKKVSKKDFKSAALDLSWIQAAKGNRLAIGKYLRKIHGKKIDITHGAWDNEHEVNTLGMPNYKADKGETTDVFFRVNLDSENPDSGSILSEHSLKKSTSANLSNSGAGYFLKWNPKVKGTDIDQKVFGEKLKQVYRDFISAQLRKKDFKDGFENNFHKYFKSLMTPNNKKELPNLTSEIREKILRFAERKLLPHYMNQKNAAAEKQVRDFIENVRKTLPNEFVVNAHNALVNDKSLQDGLLDHIAESIPLKDVFSEEEHLAIGPYSVDKSVLQKIFDVNDFEELKTNLVIKKSDNPPPETYLAYDASVAGKNGDIIPIAGFYVRQDDVGFGGAFKFDMAFHKDFSEKIKYFNHRKFYNESYEEHKKRLENENK